MVVGFFIILILQFDSLCPGQKGFNTRHLSGASIHCQMAGEAMVGQFTELFSLPVLSATEIQPGLGRNVAADS